MMNGKRLFTLALCGALFGAIGFQAGKSPSAQTGDTLRFKLMMIEIPSNAPASLIEFYHDIKGLGDDFTFARNVVTEHEAYHLPISTDGILLQVNGPRELDQNSILWFKVSDLDRVLANVAAAGGTILNAEPFDIPLLEDELAAYMEIYGDALGDIPPPGESIGRMSFVADPSGNELVFAELHEIKHLPFAFGEHAIPLSAEQIALHQNAMLVGAEFASSSVREFDRYR
jgi:predicted enzyme related to lactoylglutathione lyase